MSKPLVSVIMPVYNGADYLEKSVGSVASQNVPLELIIVDDCSADNSLEVIDRLKTLYSQLDITVLKMDKNSGVAASRNMGVNLAKGQYTAFLDCDDWWQGDKLKIQLELTEREKCPLCCTARELAEWDGTLTGRVISPPKKIFFKDLLRHNSIALSSVLIKTEIAREFPMENDHLHEDYLMWLSVLKKYSFALGIELPLLKYRKSRNAKTGNKAKSAFMQYKSLRQFGINPFKSLYYFASYAVNGIRNHGGLK